MSMPPPPPPGDQPFGHPPAMPSPAPGAPPPSGWPQPSVGPPGAPTGPPLVGAAGPMLAPTTPPSKKFPVGRTLGVLGAVAATVAGVVVFTGGDDETTAPTATSVVVSTTPGATTAEGGDAPVATAPPATAVSPDTTVTAPPNGPGVDEVAGAPTGGRGTVDAPVAPGQIADIGGGWRLQVLGFVPDATATVAAENQFNDPPPEGSTFTIVSVALGYYGLDDPQSAFMPTVAAIGADNTELDGFCGVIPDELDLFRDLFAGGVITGNLCFVTEPGDAAALRLYGVGDWFTDDAEVFLAVSDVGDATVMPALTGPQEGAAASAPRRSATPIGTGADVGAGWTVTVDGPARDITDAVLTENSFNEPPPTGFRFVGIDVTYAYEGSEGGVGFDVTTKAVGDSNVELDADCGVVPGELDQFVDVFGGGAITGTLCFVVPEGASLTLYSTASYELAPVYFATA